MTQIRNGLQKWHPGSTVFKLTSRKTEIVKCACEPRWEGLLAEDALAKQRTEKFGLITADHKVFHEGAESRHNRRYAVVAQDLATQWIQSYPCKNKNVSGDGKEFKKVPRAVGEAESHLH